MSKRFKRYLEHHIYHGYKKEWISEAISQMRFYNLMLGKQRNKRCNLN